MLSFVIDSQRYTLDSLGNGAGLYKRLDEFERALQSAATEPTFGSITRLYREGNTGGDVFYYDEATGNHINSLGLPNLGWQRYRKGRLIERLVWLARKYKKKIRISVSGFSAHDFIKVVGDIVENLVDMKATELVTIEINFSCPNTVDGGGHHHPIIAYDPELVLHIITGLYWTVGGRVALAFKFSPYNFREPSDSEIRSALCHNIDFASQIYEGDVEIVCGNTIGGQKLFKPDGSPALGVTHNIGGLAGKAVKERNLENVFYFRNNLPQKFRIVGVGGITSAQDVLDYLIAGASKVQLTGYVAKYGEKVHGEILQELVPLAEAA